LASLILVVNVVGEL